MKRYCAKPSENRMGQWIGLIFIVIGAVVGLGLLLSDLVAHVTSGDVQVLLPNLLGFAMLLFCFAGLPEGRREADPVKMPHTNT